MVFVFTNARFRTRICTTEVINGGYCTPWQREEFGHLVGRCYKSGDHWHDIKEGWEKYKYKAYLEVCCHCFACSDVAKASCRVG